MAEWIENAAEATRKWTGSLIFGPPPSAQHSFYEYIPPPPSSLPPTEGAPCVMRVHLLSEWDGPAHMDPDIISILEVEFWENETRGTKVTDVSKGIKSDTILLTFLPSQAGAYKITLDGIPIKRKSENNEDNEDNSILDICALSPWNCRFEKVPPDESLLTSYDIELKKIRPTTGRLCSIVVYCKNDDREFCQVPADIKSRVHLMHDSDSGLSPVHDVDMNYGLEYIWIKFIPQMKGKYKLCIDDAIIEATSEGREGSNEKEIHEDIEVSEFSTKYSFFEYIPSAETVSDVIKGYPLNPVEDAPCQVHIYTVDESGRHVCLPLDMSSKIRIVYMCGDGETLSQDVEFMARYSYAEVSFIPNSAGVYKVQFNNEFISGRSIDSDNVDHIEVRRLVNPVQSWFTYITPQTPAEDSIEKNLSAVEPIIGLMCSLRLEARDDNGQSTPLPKNFSKRIKVLCVQEDGNVCSVDVFHVACFKKTAEINFTPKRTGFYKIYIDDTPIERHCPDGSTAELLEVVSLSSKYSYFEDIGSYFEDMDCMLRIFARGNNDKPVRLPADLSSRIAIIQDNSEAASLEKLSWKRFNTYVEITFKPNKWGSFCILLDDAVLSRSDFEEQNNTVNVLKLFSEKHSFFEYLPRRVTVTDREGEEFYSEPLQGTRCNLRIHARDDLGHVPGHLPADARSRVRLLYKPTSHETYSQTIKLQECENKTIDVTFTPEAGGVYEITVDGEALKTNGGSSVLNVYGVIPFDESLCTCRSQEGHLKEDTRSFTFQCKRNEKFPFSKKALTGPKNIYLWTLKRVANVDLDSKDITEIKDGFMVNFQADDQLTADKVCEMFSYVLKAKHHRSVASHNRKKKCHLELLTQDALEFEHFSEASYLKKLMYAHAFVLDASEEIACDSIFTFFNQAREINTIDLCDLKDIDDFLRRLQERLEDPTLLTQYDWLEVIYNGAQATEQSEKTKIAVEKYLSKCNRDVHMISKNSFVVELRPFAESRPCHAQFYCQRCENAWVSKHSWVGYRQTCYICRVEKCFPHKFMPENTGNTSYPEPEHDAELCEKCQQVAGDCRHVNEEFRFDEDLQ